MTMLRRILYGSLLISYLFLPGVSAGAKVADTDLKSLTQQSVAIVVAKVDDVRVVGDAKVAWATAFSTFKNMPAGQKFAFIAQPTWKCDVSAAARGETVLLFLEDFRPLPTEKEKGTGWIFPKFEAAKAQQLKDLPLYLI